MINRPVNDVFDWLLWPLQGLSTTWQVILLGLPTAVLALLVYRYASNQAAILAAKEKIAAYLLELRLYPDDLRLILRAQGQVFRHVLKYMGHALLPMTVMIVPLTLIIIQVETRYAFRGLKPGESAILSSVMLDGNWPATALKTALALPVGLFQETPVLRINSTHEVHWRLRAEQYGEYRVKIILGEKHFDRRVLVGQSNGKISPSVYRANDIRTLLYPAEPALKEEAEVVAIHLSYPRVRTVFLGLSSASWILFGASLFFGFALRRLFGVTF